MVSTCGAASGWYCSRCGKRYDKTRMQGALAIRIKNKLEKTFASDLAIPDSKLANTIAFLKFVNLIRVRNMTINKDGIKDVSKLIADFKHIITGDNALAYVAPKEVGVAQKSSRVQFPLEEEIWKYNEMAVLGDKDGLA